MAHSQSIRGNVLAVLASAALLGCSAGGGSPLSVQGQEDEDREIPGTIRGTVLMGPICPVVDDPPGLACADRPYGTRLVLTTADQAAVIKEFSSDTLGDFRITAPPGEYAIRSAAAASVLPFCASNGSAFVNANATTEIKVRCDTGIR